MAPDLRDEVLVLLCCPVCKASLRRDGHEVVCEDRGCRYPVVDGVPHLTLEERLPDTPR